MDVFLDRSDDEQVRESAGHALLRIGDASTRSKMKPLAFGKNPEDTLDELKGCALLAIWPDHITVDELLNALTFPKRQNLVGSYSGFIRGPLLQHMDPSDLPVLLKWIADQPSGEVLPDLFQELMGNIILFAWKHIENVVILSALAEAILARLRLDHAVTRYTDPRIWIQTIDDDLKRRMLLKTIIPLLRDPTKDASALLSHETPVVLRRDMPWLVDQLNSAETETSQIILVELIRDVFVPSDRNQVEILLTAVQSNALLAKEFEWFWKPIELNSPEAVKIRENYNQQRERNRNLQERHRKGEEKYSDMMALLQECETGKPELFSSLTEKMILEPGGVLSNRILEGDLRRLRGWDKSDDETRKRIVKAARMYLDHNNARPDQWLRTRTVDVGVFAGYKAFHLIFTESPKLLSSILLMSGKNGLQLSWLIQHPWGSKVMRSGDSHRHSSCNRPGKNHRGPLVPDRS